MGNHATLILLIAAALAPLNAGEKNAERESVDVLKRATARVIANYENFRSLTCVETIERDYYRPRTPMLPGCHQVMEERQQGPVLLLCSRDRLRLEVATSSAGEIHAWPGASRFSDSPLGSLVPSGPIGTGPFGVLLNLIFVHDVKAFARVGELMLDGRRSLTYQFSVPPADSHFLVKSQDNTTWLVAGYEGGVRIDAESADPISLSVTANNPPPATGVCQTMTSVQLKRARVHDEDVLMPDIGRLHFVGSTGNETRSRITFSNCRLYSSESSITFYDQGEATAVRLAASPVVPAAVPDSVPFSMELVDPIDSNTAAAGDRFAARLTDSVKDGRRLIAPKGATVEGRISDVEVTFRPQQMVMFGLIPEYVDVRGAKMPFGARLDTRLQVLAKERKKRKGLEFYLPEPGEWAHQFRFNGTHAVLPKGFVSRWVTTYTRPVRGSVP